MDKSIGHAVWAKSFPWHQILIVSDGWSVGRFGREGQAELFRISLKLRDLRRHQEDVCVVFLLAYIVLRPPRIAFSSRLQLRDNRLLESSVRQHSADVRRTADEVRLLPALGTCRDSST